MPHKDKDEGLDDWELSESVQTRKGSLTPKDVLGKAQGLPFGRPDEPKVVKFGKDFDSWFSDAHKHVSDSSSILHLLAEKQGPEWPDPNIAAFLTWLLNRGHHTLLELPDREDYYPLQLAVKVRNTAFVEVVFSSDDPENVWKNRVLQQKRGGWTYLHITASITDSSFICRAAELYTDKAGFWRLGTEQGGHTPLHIAVWTVHELIRVIDKYQQALANQSAAGEHPVHPAINAIERRLASGEAPSQEDLRRPGVRTVCTWVDKLEERRREESEKGRSSGSGTVVAGTNPNAGSNGVTAHGPTRVTERLRSISPNEVAELLLELVRDRQSAPKNVISQTQIVKLCLEHDMEALKVKNTRPSGSDTSNPIKRTPYQERLHQLREAWAILYSFLGGLVSVPDEDITEDLFVQAMLRKVVVEDPVASEIRSVCIRNFEREAIIECLYRPGEELHIDLDLAGLPNRTISWSFLNRLGQHLEFESILKYVALPQLAIDSRKGTQDKAGGASARRRAISDLREVFGWLKEKRVRKIIKAIVLDFGAGHSDEVIEEALSGFHVEEWDWKKVDLCSDVIANCSKEVRVITLYSSGNNAALMGWASDEGLANKTKFPMLEHVRLFIRQGRGTADRRLKNITAFMSRVTSIKVHESAIKRHGSEYVTVEWFPDDGEVSYAEGFKNNESHVSQEVPWISRLQEFALFVGNMPRKERPRTLSPVKIAIIDDGVDASLDSLMGKIAGGKSFCPYSSSTDTGMINAYYVPSGRHGTMMADLICRICPNCQLYVARLDERGTRMDMGRQITVDSAAKAIHWAVDCGVDIISMSWTIEATKDDKDIADLEKALGEAADKKIVMFCATNDQGSISLDNCYPRGEKVIRIGAATAKGDRCSWVTKDQYDFLLPGKNVPFSFPQHHDDGSSGGGAGGGDGDGALLGKATTYESGSSFATALASGLGGLLLYCERLAGEGAHSFRSRKSMYSAFQKLALQSVNHKFPMAEMYVDGFHDALATKAQARARARAQAAAKAASGAPGNGGAAISATGIDIPPPPVQPLSKTFWSEDSLPVLRKMLDNIKTSVNNLGQSFE